MGTDQNFQSFFGETKSLLKEYMDLRIRLVKLQAIGIISRAMSLVIVAIIVGLTTAFTLLFLGMSFAWWLSEVTQSNAIGFGGAGALFFLLLLAVIIFRRALVYDPLLRLFIRETSKDLHKSDD
jgi:hypothetical protein